MGQTQWILPTSSPFSVLDKCHANVLPCHVHFYLENFWDEYNLIISISIIAHGNFTVSELMLSLAKCYTHYYCNSGPETESNKFSRQGCGRARLDLTLSTMWPWTGHFSLTFCGRGRGGECHTLWALKPGQGSVGKDSFHSSVKTSLLISLSIAASKLLFPRYWKIKIISFAHLSHLNGV